MLEAPHEPAFGASAVQYTSKSRLVESRDRRYSVTSRLEAHARPGPVSAHFVAMLRAAAPKHRNKSVFGAGSATL